ncbi:MAG: hypothetical protein IKG27_03475 [Bacilli bacterium]|nr:hypothetical protein [Bacilli bacterium]
MKKVYITLMILSASCIIFITANRHILNNSNNYTKEELEEKTKEITDTLTNTNLTYDEFTKLVGEKVPNVHIAVGPNSYLRNKPTDKQIKKYKLENYLNLQEQLVQKVERKYLDNLHYEILETTYSGNEVCQKVNITSYYYATYLDDLINITSNLTNKDLDDIATSEKTQIEFFKVQVLALKVLDNHLEDYNNVNNESVIFPVCYVNGKIKNSDDMIGFIGALQGERYENMDYSKNENIKKADERVKKYLEEAKQIKI